MRVLGRVRISRSTEESTSVQRQRELIQNWAEANGHEIVAWAEDVDVSGSVSPFEAPALGPYLTDTGKEGWDILVAWKLDRLARSSITLHALFGWVEENDKQLVSISENLDMSNWIGRMVAGVIAGVAEGELETIRERVSAGMRALREAGRWQGGNPPLGYGVAKREGGGFELVKDPREQQILQEIYRLALENYTATDICKHLEKNGVPTTTVLRTGEGSGTWHSTVVLELLRNKVYLGWTVHDGQVLLDDNGDPVMRCEPSISIEDYNRIQELIDARSVARSRKAQTSPLLGVLVCWECGENMHLKRGEKETANAYYCKVHRYERRVVNAVQAEARLAELFREQIADLPVLIKMDHAAVSPAAELARYQATYKETLAFLPTAPDAATRQAIFEQLEKIGQKITDLEKRAEFGPGVDWVDTGETYGERWDKLDTQGRRRMLVAAGIKFRANQITRGTRWGPGIQESELILPEELKLVAHAREVNLAEAEAEDRRRWWKSLPEEDRAALLEAGIGTDLREEE